MKKTFIAVLVSILTSSVFAGVVGIDISGRWFNASTGNYSEKLSTFPTSFVHGDFPAVIYEGSLRLPLLGPIGADIKARYGTVGKQTMYLDNMPGSGNMTTTIDATIIGGRVDPGFSLGFGAFKADIFGSAQYVYTRKNFYDWKNGATMVAAGDAGHFIINYFLAGAGARLTVDLGGIGLRGEIIGYPVTSNTVDYINPSGPGSTKSTGSSYMYEAAAVLKPLPFFEVSGGYRYEDIFFGEDIKTNNYSLSIKLSGIFVEGKISF